MTANTDATFEFTINQIALNAFRKASAMSLQEPAAGVQWDLRVQAAYQMLELIMKRVEAQGKLSRARKFLNVQLIAGQNEYPLSTTVMDVFEDAAFIPLGQDPDSAVGVTPVKQIDMEQWQRLGDYSAQNRPQLYFLYRAADPLTVRVWPKPSAAEAGILRLQVYRFLGQNNDGTKALDAERYWASYFVTALAADIAEAENQPSDKVMRLKAEAAQLLVEAKSYSHQRTPGQVVNVHRGPFYHGARYR